MENADIVIVGAGAAGLMAGIAAGREAQARGSNLHIVVLDGAPKIGAKILVSGGGRCNVTHDIVDERAYFGSSRKAIRNVLREFDVENTIAFFQDAGVELKREETGKLFPVTDSAHTVLDALLRCLHLARGQLLQERRVSSIRTVDAIDDHERFEVRGDWGAIMARCVILATGGRSLPKTGSDGHGYSIAKSFGHSLTSRTFPALVPLKLPADHFACSLPGLSHRATVAVHTSTGKHVIDFTDSLLCTHFGLSGPAILDISRHWLALHADDAGAQFVVNWLPGETFESVDQMLLSGGRATVHSLLHAHMPERLARAIAESQNIATQTRAVDLNRETRRALAHALTAMPLPVTGTRGFKFAEVTAGGVPLAEIEIRTMQSRKQPGLYLCGEICDVDGRIGGYNFQWAWSSGHVAGVASARACTTSPDHPSPPSRKRAG